MNDYIDQAFKKMEECFKLMEQGINHFFREKEKPGTRIKVKKGSTVYIGDGLHVTLLQDVEAIIQSKK